MIQPVAQAQRLGATPVAEGTAVAVAANDLDIIIAGSAIGSLPAEDQLAQDRVCYFKMLRTC